MVRMAMRLYPGEGMRSKNPPETSSTQELRAVHKNATCVLAACNTILTTISVLLL